MLPRVKIQFLNGQLGTVGESADGFLGLIASASAVSTSFQLYKAYTLTSLDDLVSLGVTEENNAVLYKHVKEFYCEAENGTQFAVWGVGGSIGKAVVGATNASGAKGFIEQMNGRLRGVLIALSIPNDDFDDALADAQALGKWATETMFAPVWFCFEKKYAGNVASMPDVGSYGFNRVCVVTSDTESNSEGACVGLLGGRIAKISVQRNVGRVKDGNLGVSAMYLGTGKVDGMTNADAEALYSKGYIFARRYVGRSGYFFSDDSMACGDDDDYAHLTARRVVDKAYRIAYNTLLDMLLDEIEVNEDGTIQNASAASWQQAVEDAINQQMTANGELSAAEGEGCKCYIDPSQNVVRTNSVKIVLKVRPFGYARYIDVSLGFLVEG